MELLRVLDDIASALEQARAMPMSSSVVVNRPQLLALIEQAEKLIPQEMREADRVMEARQVLLGEAEDQAREMVQTARAERERLISTHDVYIAARMEADRVRDEAEAEARRMRAEVDDYVDGKLANLEVALTRTLEAVTVGRDRIRQRVEERESHL
jgi:hypothetical protein